MEKLQLKKLGRLSVSTKNEKVTCALCGFIGLSLVNHVRMAHGIPPKEYQLAYGGKLESPLVQEKRERTNQARYNDPHYTNREAAALSNELYEGGHSLRDPEVRKKAEETSLKLYGVKHFTNREKARATNLERYGVESILSTEKARNISRKNMKELIASGKAYCGKNKKDCPDVGLLKSLFHSGKRLGDIAMEFQVSAIVLDRWIKELGLHRENVVGSTAPRLTTEEVLIKFKEECHKEGKVLSPYTFSQKLKDPSLVCRLKRLISKSPEIKKEISDSIKETISA